MEGIRPQAVKAFPSVKPTVSSESSVHFYIFAGYLLPLRFPWQKIPMGSGNGSPWTIFVPQGSDLRAQCFLSVHWQIPRLCMCIPVDPPDHCHRSESADKSHAQIRPCRDRKADKNHLSRVKPVTQHPVTELSDPVSEEIYHTDKSCLAFRQNCLLNHRRHR